MTPAAALRRVKRTIRALKALHRARGWDPGRCYGAPLARAEVDLAIARLEDVRGTLNLLVFGNERGE